ncbi:MAG: GlxA family transcriptional regulator [Nocardioides sp.]
MRVALVVAPGYLPSALATMLDVLRVGAEFAPAEQALAVDVLGASAHVRSQSSLSCRADGNLADVAAFDTITVIGSAARTMPALDAELRTTAVRKITRALTGVPATTLVAAACTGTFVLAEAGLLDGYRATTSWWLAPQFSQRYPRVELDDSAMVIPDRNRMTAGAALAHIDLALALVRRASAVAAEQTARFLLIDERPSQGIYAAIDQLAVSDPSALAFEREVRRRLSEPLELSKLAVAIGTSRRTLDRKVRRAFGSSPLQVVRQLRCEQARHLHATTTLSMEQIARAVGYQHSSTVRALLNAGRLSR